MDDSKRFFHTFVESSYESLTELDNEIIRLEGGDYQKEHIEALRRILHTIKGSCSMFGFDNAARVAHALEDLVVLVNSQGTVSRGVTELCFKGADLLRRLIEDFVNAGGEDTGDPDSADNFIERIRLVENTLTAAGNQASSPELAGALEAVLSEIALVREDLDGFRDFSRLDDATEQLKNLVLAQPEAEPEAEESPREAEEIAGYNLEEWQELPNPQGERTVRVAEKKVDLFLDCVGELIEVAEVCKHLRRQLEETGLTQESLSEFNGITQQMEENVFDLKKALMEIRRVSLGGIFNNLPRLVRDVADDLGKEAEIITSGEDAVVDKSLLDQVEACIIQLTRNAVAHGIERPQARREAGKPPKGRISLSARNDDQSLLLEITDDGGGLNLKKIRQRADSLNLFSSERLAAMTDEELSMLIFTSGMTTADHVDMSSGRGVGLDVVANSMKDMGGNVSVKTQAGQGTAIRVRIPLDVTLSVITGIIAQTGELRFVMPVEAVIESVSPTPEMLNTIKGQNETLLLRNTVLPFYRSGPIFGIKEATTDILKGVAVIFHSRKHGSVVKAAFFFDQLVDIQQVVVKNIAGIPISKAILGGAILGDGHIGLVLNPEALCDER
ncbi:MAG: Hpt domain-containing protein [Planctomycetes bacterium]|nr:Hpt domain-containing protein [Planctomycetota bacterium]